MGSLPLWANAALFALGAAAIWWAGTALEHYTDVKNVYYATEGG